MDYIKIGKIVNTHGIKGEVRLLSKFPYKDKVFVKDMNIYIDKKYKEVINSYRKHKNFDMITLVGYDNINDVLKYKGLNVYVNKDDIRLDSNKYLDEDIIGSKVIYKGINVGEIKDIERYDKYSLLVILGKKEYLIPYNDNLIEKILQDDYYSSSFKEYKIKKPEDAESKFSEYLSEYVGEEDSVIPDLPEY